MPCIVILKYLQQWCLPVPSKQPPILKDARGCQARNFSRTQLRRASTGGTAGSSCGDGAAVAARICVWGSTSRHGGVSGSTSVVAVSEGTAHTCAVNTPRVWWCLMCRCGAGGGGVGRLGLDDSGNRNAPHVHRQTGAAGSSVWWVAVVRGGGGVGQLGPRDTVSRDRPHVCRQPAQPVEVPDVSLWCWGGRRRQPAGSGRPWQSQYAACAVVSGGWLWCGGVAASTVPGLGDSVNPDKPHVCRQPAQQVPVAVMAAACLCGAALCFTTVSAAAPA